MANNVVICSIDYNFSTENVYMHICAYICVNAFACIYRLITFRLKQTALPMDLYTSVLSNVNLRALSEKKKSEEEI